MIFTYRWAFETAIVPGARCQQLDYFGIINARIGTQPVRELPGGDILRDGYEQSGDMYMPSEMAMRLDQFIWAHYVDCRINFNCHSFVWFLMGWGRSDDVYDRTYRGTLADSSSLYPFTPYVFLRGDISGKLMHIAFAVSDTLTLGVNGMNGSMILAEASHLMDVYGADTILRADNPHVCM